MDKQQLHRYEIWTAATKDQLWPLKPGAPARPGQPQPQPQEAKKHIARRPKPVSAPDDLNTSIMLYGYGLPIELALEGICTLPNGQSAKCKTTKISSDSVDVVYVDDVIGRPRENMPTGTTVDLTLDEVGAFRGVLTAQNSEGFQVAVDSAYKNVLGAKLSHIAAQRGIAPPEPVEEIPSNTRIELTYKDCWFLDHTATLRRGTIVNLSQIDVLLRAPIIPPMGAQIVFRGQRRFSGEVTSIFKIGFVVKFTVPIPGREFSAALKFSDV
jgi:hypothetical protein